MKEVKKDGAIEAVIGMAIELSEGVKDIAIAVENSTGEGCYKELVTAAMGAFTGSVAAAAGHSSMPKDMFERNLREMLEDCIEDAETTFDINRFTHKVLCNEKETTDETETMH